MKRTSFFSPSLLALAIAALLAVSCAGTPAKAPEAQKQRKERTITVQVPVVVKETSYFADGLVDEFSVYKYDAGLLALIEKDTYDAARTEPIERLVSESESGRVKSETTWGSDGKIRFRREFAYDQAGRIVEERTVDPKGTLQSSSTYAYDAAGKRTEWKALDGKGIVKALTRYSYDKERLVLIDMRDGSGNKTGSIAIEYDGAGHPIRRAYKAPDGSLQKTELATYVAGKPSTLDTLRADGSLASRTAYTWGELGQLLATVTTDSAGAVKDKRTFEYSIRQDQKTEVYWE